MVMMLNWISSDPHSKLMQSCLFCEILSKPQFLHKLMNNHKLHKPGTLICSPSPDGSQSESTHYFPSDLRKQVSPQKHLLPRQLCSSQSCICHLLATEFSLSLSVSGLHLPRQAGQAWSSCPRERNFLTQAFSFNSAFKLSLDCSL